MTQLNANRRNSSFSEAKKKSEWSASMVGAAAAHARRLSGWDMLKQSHKDKKFSSLFKECAVQWSVDTTCHGFKNMVQSESWIVRIVWLSLIVTSISYCLYSK
jgi:hypothetical protein